MEVVDEKAALTDGPRPRLCIQQLVLENFKSYAGKQTIGPFHKSFSAIVGPNGSGKSNVIDALLFVFGKRAKQIRLNKVSELIHNSDEHQDLDSARVEVHFVDIIDSDDGTEGAVVPDSEITVSRAAYKDNTSKYFINNKKASRNDVEDLLSSKGIDLENNRFLILQGEVEQIAMMKPKGQTEHETGFLEYLEDVIGSNRFVEAIAEKGAAVESLNEDRSLKLNRVKGVEGERENLEGAKTEAEDFLRKELQLCQKQKVSFMLCRAECKERRSAVEGKKEETDSQLQQQQELLKESMGKLENFETVYASKTAEYEGIATELAQSKAEFAAYERKDVKFREDLKHAKEKEKKLKDTAKKETAKVAKETAALSEAESQMEQHQVTATELTVNVQNEEQKLEEIYDRWA
jgi:structural maintenance of chromosome 4